MDATRIYDLSSTNVWGVIALIAVILALAVWIIMLLRANRDPSRKHNKEAEGKLKRGPVSGGAIHGDPGQSILTGHAQREAERREERENSAQDL